MATIFTWCGYSFQYSADWMIKDKLGARADYDPLDPKRTEGIDAYC